MQQSDCLADGQVMGLLPNKTGPVKLAPAPVYTKNVEWRNSTGGLHQTWSGWRASLPPHTHTHTPHTYRPMTHPHTTTNNNNNTHTITNLPLPTALSLV